MSYDVTFDFCEVHELISSFHAYTNKKSHKSLELGKDWTTHVQEMLSPKFNEELRNLKSQDVWPDLLLLNYHNANRTTLEFLQWMDRLPVGELYERMSIRIPKGSETFHHLVDWRNRMTHLFFQWNEDYFQHIDPAILNNLKKDALDKQRLIGNLHPIDVIEEATNGLRIEIANELEQVILVPQYHFQPLILQSLYKGLHIYYYPADIQNLKAGSPPPSLMRSTKSLADENRLRILRFLVTGEKSFTDIVHYIGLAKSTVHYHMLSLRSSGLVRVHVSTVSGERYSLRQGAFDNFQIQLTNYFEQ